MKTWIQSLWALTGEHPPGRSWKRLLPLWIIALVAAPLARVLFLWAGRNPQAVESLYSRGIYPVLSHAVARLVGWLPFSLAEWGLYGLIAGAVALLVIQGIRFFTRPYPVYRLCRVTGALLAGASLAYFIFYGVWGLQYQRMPLSDTLGYDSVAPIEEAALKGLCRTLIARTNEAALATDRQADGSFAPSGSMRDTLRGTVTAWEALGGEVDALATAAYPPPKGVVASIGLSYANITGIFIPYTMEANVNVMTPAALLPSTAAHEAAHQHGFAREDEANYLSFRACRASGLPEYVYSGYLLASIHVLNAVYASYPADYGEMLALCGPEMSADLWYNNRFWAQYEGPVAEQSTASNDAYLRGNLQADGVASYGRMVELLAAEYRENPDMR